MRRRTDYQGPYRVTSCIREKIYVIEDLRGRIIGVYHKRRLKPFLDPETTDDDEDGGICDGERQINMIRVSESEEEREREKTKERIIRIPKSKEIKRKEKGYLMKSDIDDKNESWTLIVMSDSEPEPNIGRRDEIKIVVLPEVSIELIQEGRDRNNYAQQIF